MATAHVVMAGVTADCGISCHPAGTGGLFATFGVTVQHSMSAGPGQYPGVDVWLPSAAHAIVVMHWPVTPTVLTKHPASPSAPSAAPAPSVGEAPSMTPVPVSPVAGPA